MKKILFVGFIALSVNGFAQKVNGKLSFPKGQKLELVTETKKTSASEMMGQSIESTINSTITEVFDVQDASTNGATIEHKVKRLVFNANAMGTDQSYDSDKESDRNSEHGKMLQKTINNTYKMTVDPYGKVTAVKSADDTAKTKNADEEAIAGIMSQQLGISFGMPKSGESSVFKILPNKEIKQGDTWTDSSSVNGQKKTTTYKVNSITDNEVLLDYTEDVNVNSTQQIMGVDANIKATDKAVGQITIDRKTGLLKQKTATVDSKATMEAQGMTIPTTGKTTITVTLKPA
jgi:hypothetical protein